MRICFSGFGSPMCVAAAAVSVLEVQNRTLFARVCESLVSGLGVDAIEPYSLWDDAGVEMKTDSRFLLICSPLELPWDDKALSGGLASQFERIVFEDEGVRRDIEDLFELFQSRLSQAALELNSNYAFGVNWELKRYLRTFGFGVELADGEPLIDKLIKFLMLAKDASLKKVLVFINLKLFLTEKELDLFLEQAFFSRLSIILIENVLDHSCHLHERKYAVDQDLLESW